MLTQKMRHALNTQIREEMYSANLYLAMSAYCEVKAFKGFGRWLKVQYGEELSHANKLIDYLVDRGAQVELEPIGAPPPEFGTMLKVFEGALDHERHITECVQNLYNLAVAEKDTATQVFLHWFVTEQVEEERAVSEIVDKLRMVGDKDSAALYLDKEYGKRGKE